MACCYHNNRPSAAACTRCGLSAGAVTAAQSRRCSAARSARRRGLWPQPGGWRCDPASRRAEPRPPARADTGYTPPDHTAAATDDTQIRSTRYHLQLTFVSRYRSSPRGAAQ